jgi:hypothetical protein
LVHGRRTSCVDREPSASKKELSRPLEAVIDPTCDEGYAHRVGLGSEWSLQPFFGG